MRSNGTPNGELLAQAPGCVGFGGSGGAVPTGFGKFCLRALEAKAAYPKQLRETNPASAALLGLSGLIG